ncbi:MAG: hypothetical protein IKD96_04355 [Oscillospiraceae bacterium]|nr:hypothetical protein [Oscillospiraceae bacterium]
MRRVLLCVLTMTLLLLPAGCAGQDRAEARAMELLELYDDLEACSLTAELLADYGERTYTFTVDVVYDRDGTSRLTILEPDLLAGLTVRWQEETATLEYDGTTVETGYLTEDGLSPMTALPALLEAVRSGGLTACSTETWKDGRELLRLSFSDGTVSDTVWFDPDTGAPVRGEIAAEGYTVITCTVTDFRFG